MAKKRAAKGVKSAKKGAKATKGTKPAKGAKKGTKAAKGKKAAGKKASGAKPAGSKSAKGSKTAKAAKRSTTAKGAVKTAKVSRKKAAKQRTVKPAAKSAKPVKSMPVAASVMPAAAKATHASAKSANQASNRKAKAGRKRAGAHSDSAVEVLHETQLAAMPDRHETPAAEPAGEHADESEEGHGTKASPWTLHTPRGKSEYRAYKDASLSPPALVVQVGKTELRYHLSCIEDLHAMLRDHGNWVPLGSADERDTVKEGTVEDWARSPRNPVGGWYGLKSGLRGRFANYVPPVLQKLGMVEFSTEGKETRVRAV